MNKKLKTVKIKGKDYVEVKERILFLASEDNKKPYSINTDYQFYPKARLWVVKATLTLGEQIYTGLAQEVESDDPKQVNFASALENAETSAVGRACAMAGIGVVDSIASADEVRKAQSRGSQFKQPATTDGKLIHISIDFDKKDMARNLGARWNGQKKTWDLADTQENRDKAASLPATVYDADGVIIPPTEPINSTTTVELDDLPF